MAQSNNRPSNKRESGGKSNTAIFISFGVVVVALFGVVIFLLMREPVTTPPIVVLATPTPMPNVLVGMSKEEIDKLREEQAESSNRNNIIVSLATEVSFENGNSEGRIDIDNVKENKFSFTVEYFLGDGTSVLKTGLLAPGYSLEKQKLDVDLPKGVYVVSAIHTTYDIDGVEVGKVGVEVTFTVKN